MTRKTFTVVVTKDQKGRAIVPVPFDPDQVWGVKAKHHVAGTIDGQKIRGTVQAHGEGYAVVLGAMWVRDCGLRFDTKVRVVLEAEGPQRDDLAPDIAEALRKNPKAGAFFDELAQFYRKAYLRWIDSTKRSPEERARRIAETVKLLAAGSKQR
jgi:hypothetical protein